MNLLRCAEEALFAKQGDAPAASPVFVVASPRTGSTFVYQLLVNLFGFGYFSNWVDRWFAEQPAVGVAIESWCKKDLKQVPYESTYGETRGKFGPSEASWVFRNWFGGGFPSEINSGDFLSREHRSHMQQTLAAVSRVWGRSLVTKNAWNCFRIRALAEAFPRACFVWVRRDIRTAAMSDLRARILQNSPWNSATTANYRELMKLPPHESVVEQQYEYNIAVRDSLRRHCEGRHSTFWYEDLCEDPMFVACSAVADWFETCGVVFRRCQKRHEGIIAQPGAGLDEVTPDLATYVAKHEDRLDVFCWR